MKYREGYKYQVYEDEEFKSNTFSNVRSASVIGWIPAQPMVNKKIALNIILIQHLMVNLLNDF